ncbi:MAG: hypothetical protein KGI67_03920 [Pseudomonadota bacterium]|nr:hypothetical protein [Pseudomonadota bacterium]
MRNIILVRSWAGMALAAAAASVLLACGGGGGTAASPAATGAASPALSAGTVTAFGSVFVNGHEFDSSAASVIDDDTGTHASGSAAGTALAVGMSVDVTPTAGSTNAAPKAQEIRIVPVARGPVDASDAAAGQLSVMGQVVRLTAGSVFKDARACVQASSSPCTPITAQSGLTPNCTQASAASAYACSATAGVSSVQVFGFVDSATNTLTATLVRVIDNTSPAVFRATGAITVAASGTPPAAYTINGLSFAPSTACSSTLDCSFSSGNVVTTLGTLAPTPAAATSQLPIPVVFAPLSLHGSRASSLTVGATVELEGIVSNAGGSTYMLQGVTVTLASGQSLPANGDTVEVSGTVTSAAPPAITAISESTEDSASHRQGGGFLLEDTLATGAVTTGVPATTPPTYGVALLGTSVQINALTRMEDETANTAQAFNITNFDKYLAAAAGGMPHVVVRGYIDTSGSVPVLVATEFRITAVPSAGNYNARVDGRITAISGSGFSVDGVALTLPSALGIVDASNQPVSALASGDYVRVRLNDTSGALSVTRVVDFGAAHAQQGGD